MRPREICLNHTKSPNDKKEYRYVTLSTGLEAMLVSVSDKSKIVAGAAMAVGCGSLYDPETQGGLAHYTEHMLFMGSKKYPGENEYGEFLSAHGGDFNAYTDSESTVYYFEMNLDEEEDGEELQCKGKSFAKACDIFAQFFTQPVFRSDSSSREIEAIESEFRMQQNKNSVRLEQLIFSLANRKWLTKLLDGPEVADKIIYKRHVYDNFGYGNKESLHKSTDEELSKMLRDFHKQHYTAERMRLVLYGNISFDSLRQILHQSFSDIPSSLKKREKSTFSLPYSRDQLPFLLRVKSMKSVHHMHLLFQTDSVYAHPDEKPLDLLEHFLGHECEGSIMWLLRNKGLATELSASGSAYVTSICSIFLIKIVLTKQGLRRWEEVGEIVFAYLRLLRNEGKTSVTEKMFDEVKDVAEMNFRFKEECQPSYLISELSERMLEFQNCKKEDLLNDEEFKKFDSQLLDRILNDFVVDNLIIILVSSDYCKNDTSDEQQSCSSENSESTSQTSSSKETESESESQNSLTYLDPGFLPTKEFEEEPYFGTKFQAERLSPEIQKRWRETAKTEGLHLPKKNLFIAKNFDLLQFDEKSNFLSQVDISGQSEVPNFPQVKSEKFLPVRLQSDFLSRFYYLGNYNFPLPRCCLMLIVVPKSKPNLHFLACSKLWRRVVEAHVNDLVYQGEMAGLSFVMSSMKDGNIKLEFSGFSDKLPVFFDSILKAILEKKNFDERIFESQKERRLQQLKNSNFQAVDHSQYLYFRILLPWTVTKKDLVTKTETLEVQNLYEFEYKLFNEFESFFSVQGNCNEKEARKYEEIVKKNFHFRRSERFEPSLKQNIVTIRPKKTLVCVENSADPKNKNSCILMTFQVLDYSKLSCLVQAEIELLSQIVYEPFFDSLRTKQQLGYSVYPDSHTCRQRLVGLEFTVQSASASCDELVRRVEEFLDEFYEKLKTMPKSEYESYLLSFAGTSVAPDNSLGEAAASNNAWIEKDFADFDRNFLMYNHLKTLKRSELLEVYEDYVLRRGKKRSLILVCVVGNRSSRDSVVGEIKKIYPDSYFVESNDTSKLSNSGFVDFVTF